MKTIPTRFKNDPEWYQVEEIVKEFIDPLINLLEIDTTQTAEDVKSEVIGRVKAYEALQGFVRSRGIEKSTKLPENKENIFK